MPPRRKRKASTTPSKSKKAKEEQQQQQAPPPPEEEEPATVAATVPDPSTAKDCPNDDDVVKGEEDVEPAQPTKQEEEEPVKKEEEVPQAPAANAANAEAANVAEGGDVDPAEEIKTEEAVDNGAGGSGGEEAAKISKSEEENDAAVVDNSNITNGAAETDDTKQVPNLNGGGTTHADTTESAPTDTGATETKAEVAAAAPVAITTADNNNNNTASNPQQNPGIASNTGVTSASNPTPATTQAPPVSAPAAIPTGVPTSHTPSAPVVASAPAMEATIEEKGEVSTLYVGRVIGKGGEMIRDLQARSGCRIDVDQNVPDGAPRIITYRGTRSTIDFAKHLVQILCSEGGKEAELPLGQAIRKQIQVPGTVIGKIIGRGGEMIRELQSKSAAKIQVDHTGGGVDSDHRQVTVTGTEQSVVKAEEMILFLCANPAMDAMQAIAMLIRDKTQSGGVWGSGPPYPNLPNQGQGMPGAAEMGMGGGMYGGGGGGGGYGQQNMGYGGYGGAQQGAYGQQYGQVGGGGGVGGIEAEMFPCAKMYMGRVIGQKGVTINDLQKRSGCDIQINQNVPPGQDCEISIKGSRQGIEMAKQMLQEIIELGPNHPYAGGHGQFGGGRNQFGNQQGYQQQPFQQGYQGYQQQSYAPQYGMQQHFGGGQMYQPQPPFQPQQMQPYGQPGVPPPFGAPPAQASPWRSATAADGQIYYYNEKTGQTQWDKPAEMP